MVWPKGKTQAKDLIGMTFNRLTVIERSERKSGGKAWWRCQCECGGTAVVTPKAAAAITPATDGRKP